MKKSENNKIAPELLMGIDLSNSFNGGSSEIENWFKATEAGYEFAVKVPGVKVDDLIVEVIQDRVLVYYMFPVYSQEDDNAELFARVIANFSLPSDADYERVAATYLEKSRRLAITMPFNEHKKGYRSKVEIDR